MEWPFIWCDNTFEVDIEVACLYMWGTWWHSWLRHCATSWKVTSLIPDGVFEVFHWLNPSSRTVALVLTQPLKEMSTKSISWG